VPLGTVTSAGRDAAAHAAGSACECTPTTTRAADARTKTRGATAPFRPPSTECIRARFQGDPGAACLAKKKGGGGKKKEKKCKKKVYQ
jgi:hypothetical protein